MSKPKITLLGELGESYFLACGKRMLLCKVGIPINSALISSVVLDRISALKKSDGSPLFRLDVCKPVEALSLVNRIGPLKFKKSKSLKQKVISKPEMEQLRFETWL